MILFIEVIVVLGLIAFPIVTAHFKGLAEWFWIKGIVLGINGGSHFFSVEIEAKKRIFQMYTIQFHLICITVSMAFSIERPDMIEEE